MRSFAPGRRLATLVFALMLVAPAPARAQNGAVAQDQPLIEVDVELVLAADGSGSITDVELAVQRQGYADAIQDPRVLEAIESGLLGRIAIAYIEWGGARSQEIIADWALIDGPESAKIFADTLIDTPRKATGWNSISNAIWRSAAMIRDNQYEAFRRVIDVSGDSGQRGGLPLQMVRDEVTAEGVTINGLALHYRGGGMTGPSGEPLEFHYRRDVVGGPGAFVMTVDDPADFAEAVVRKLVLEIADRSGARPRG